MRFDIAFVALGVALTLVVTQKTGARVALILLMLITLQINRGGPLFTRIFAVYLTTIVHVFAFLVAALVTTLAPAVDYVTISDWGRENYGAAFHSLTANLLSDFGGVRADRAFRVDLFSHPKAIPVVRFLAFAYTYHYLNWFSKTSIIGWHQIPTSRGVAILAIWAASLGLYFSDYALGLSWLFLFSFGHVVLEFPLNFHTVHGLFGELRTRLASTNVAN